MSSSSKPEDWVLALRVFIKDTMGDSWQIVKNKEKVMLGIRFKDKSRTYTYLPYKWQRANQGKIRSFIENVWNLHIKKKIGIKEAIERVKASAPRDEINKATKTNFKDILNAWEKYGIYLTTTTNKVSESTYKKSYGQTYRALVNSAKSEDIHNLLVNIGKQHEAGCRTRQQNVQRVAACIRWATSKKGGFLLDEYWIPPQEGELGDYIGRKSRELQIKTDTPTVPILDDDFIKLLASIEEKFSAKHRIQREQAKKWHFCLQLVRTYGLRPIEMNYLQIRRNGKDTLWCVYPKQTNDVATLPRRLRPIHKNWEEEWNLIKRVKNKEPLPETMDGDSFGTYLGRNSYWKELKSKAKFEPYSLRHGYAVCGHSYNIAPSVLASAMGHDVDVHNKSYSRWVGEDYFDDLFDKATQS